MPDKRLLSVTMPLGQLLDPWITSPSFAVEMMITGMTLDSRTVSQGTLFVAIAGAQVDGRDYIAQAIAAGATAVLSETDEPEYHGRSEYRDGAWLIDFYQLPQRLSAIAGRFYDDPAKKLTLVGVTGTNGKTTVTQLMAQWLTLLGERCYSLGTLGNGLYGELTPSVNTTASAIDVQQQLAMAVAAGAGTVVMEVSSHGLVQHRIQDLCFDVAIFTNLSRDHLDYHGDMTNYADAKKQLFSHLHCRQGILNGKDPVSHQWLADWPADLPVSCFHQSPLPELPALTAEQISFSEQGLSATVIGHWGHGQLSSKLMGAFNLDNLLAALQGMIALGYSPKQLLALAPQLDPVDGRMESFSRVDGPTAVVDFAHTPDALEQALKALRVHCQGRLWVVFGCGGDRDQGKRPLMARSAEQFADQLVITSDNPRSESPQFIASQILAGLANPEAVLVELDRAQAVQLALTRANKADLVLIAGKGHEDYQIVAGKKLNYNERDWVNTLQESRQ